ncbi:Tetratricopeptide repeat [Seminavis robusta]|uniref:Tetratricopeptide repeat n=1 Tax=Seminavis robusta TaxID=568900 RepID=A0A9N8DTW7_9STRA|nr:Tetratricopeptide repeat [Seminavis robusta]|eukprot:Sro287_g108500.1 Tetratricopeptide repeat (819) ;mRNA; r:10137-12593
MIRPDEASAEAPSQNGNGTTIPFTGSNGADIEQAWRTHAARLNNVGGLLFQKGGDLLLPAMQFLQEGVQAMMALENPNATITAPPAQERAVQVQGQLELLLQERRRMQQEIIKEQDRKLPARKGESSDEDKKPSANIAGSSDTTSTETAPQETPRLEPERSTAGNEIPQKTPDNLKKAASTRPNGTELTTRQLEPGACQSSLQNGKNGKHCCKDRKRPAIDKAADVTSADEHVSENPSANSSNSRPEIEEGSSSSQLQKQNVAQHHSDNSKTEPSKTTTSARNPVAETSVARAPSTEKETKTIGRASLPSASESQEEIRRRKRINSILSQFDAESTGSVKDASSVLLDNTLDEETTVLEHTNFLLQGIPGLFPMTSKMRGAEKKNENSILVFSEPFLVDVDAAADGNGKIRDKVPLREGPDAGAFCVPLDQCSRACLFNMGLVHYQWNSADSAIQFFELSLSLAPQQPSLLTFDPLALACINNVGQILLQLKGKMTEAKGMFSDALSRGNSALVELYRNEGENRSFRQSPELAEAHKLTSRLLRRFLVRSLMNMGFVHFFNCDYELATRTCLDAMRLLRPNMLEVDAAALWYNISMSHHHQNELHEALVYLDKFLDVAVSYLGVLHLQVATALHRKGFICYEMGNLYDSTKPMLQALRIRKRHFGNVHPLVADSLCLLGKIYLDREEFRFAQNALLQALSVLRSLNEDDHLCLDIAQTLIDLGRACHSQGQIDESLKAYLEAVSLTKKMFGERHAYVARMKNVVGNLFLEQGEVNQAVEFFARSMRIQVGEGRPVDYNIVQNPHVRVKFSHCPTSASA